MGTHKLLLDDDLTEDFSLIAIHCSEEAYKIAYLLNQFVRLRLKRNKLDLEFTNHTIETTFPVFKFEDHFNYTDYTLLANKSKTLISKIAKNGELFGNTTTQENITTYLIPEFKQVDYFLKIQSDFDTIGTRIISTAINDIKQVISAYEIDTETLKSKNNLIFD